jgi:hypothetical protein
MDVFLLVVKVCSAAKIERMDNAIEHQLKKDFHHSEGNANCLYSSCYKGISK